MASQPWPQGELDGEKATAYVPRPTISKNNWQDRVPGGCPRGDQAGTWDEKEHGPSGPTGRRGRMIRKAAMLGALVGLVGCASPHEGPDMCRQGFLMRPGYGMNSCAACAGSPSNYQQ